MGFMCKSVVILSLDNLTLRSKNATFFSLDSYVNLRLGWNLLRSFKNNSRCSLPWVVVKFLFGLWVLMLQVTFVNHLSVLFYRFVTKYMIGYMRYFTCELGHNNTIPEI